MRLLLWPEINSFVGENFIMSKQLALTNRYHELLSANNITRNVKHFVGLNTEIAVSEDGYIAIYHPHIPEQKVDDWSWKKEILPEQQEWLEILHISQINDIDIDVDGTETTSVSGGLGGAVVGGLLGGAVGAVIGAAATSGSVTSNTTCEAVSLIFHTKDFNNPRIEVPLYRSPEFYFPGKNMSITHDALSRIEIFPAGLHQHLKHSKLIGVPLFKLTKEGRRLLKEVYNNGQPNWSVVEELVATLSQLFNAHQQSEAAAASAPQLSAADELAKFKGLLDSGVITQEEFDVKKRQLLDL